MTGTRDGAFPFTAAEGRRFGLLLGGAFLVLASVLVWRGRGLYVVVPTAALALALALWGVFAPARLQRVYRLWMGLARALARVTTPVFMSIMYFVVLTPVGVIRRLAGGNPLVARGSESFWMDRAHGRKSSMERQF